MMARISWCIALRRRSRYTTKPARPSEPMHASTITTTSHVGAPARARRVSLLATASAVLQPDGQRKWPARGQARCL